MSETGSSHLRDVEAVAPDFRARATLGLLLAGCAAAVGACGPAANDAGSRSSAGDQGYRGTVLSEPLPAPDFTLRDTNGRPFHFARETEGHITLLFFGYTHCPDVCPVHMANLAEVLEDLPYRTRRRFKVVFVTTDPERDTPERLRTWLDAFDRDFIGLLGDLDTVNAIQARLHLPPAVKQDTAPGSYLVGHASQVVAFGPDGRARVVYPFGTRQADWAHDLPRLAESLERPPPGG